MDNIQDFVQHFDTVYIVSCKIKNPDVVIDDIKVNNASNIKKRILVCENANLEPITSIDEFIDVISKYPWTSEEDLRKRACFSYRTSFQDFNSLLSILGFSRRIVKINGMATPRRILWSDLDANDVLLDKFVQKYSFANTFVSMLENNKRFLYFGIVNVRNITIRVVIMCSDRFGEIGSTQVGNVMPLLMIYVQDNTKPKDYTSYNEWWARIALSTNNDSVKWCVYDPNEYDLSRDLTIFQDYLKAMPCPCREFVPISLGFRNMLYDMTNKYFVDGNFDEEWYIYKVYTSVDNDKVGREIHNYVQNCKSYIANIRTKI